MMKKRFLLIPAVLAITMGVGALTAFATSQHNPAEKAEWMVYKLSKTLALTADQKSKLDVIKNEILKQHSKLHAKHTAVIDKLIVEVQKPNLDPVFFTNMLNQHKAELDKILPTVIEKLSVFHASLTAEQKMKLVNVLQKFKNRDQKPVI